MTSSWRERRTRQINDQDRMIPLLCTLAFAGDSARQNRRCCYLAAVSRGLICKMEIVSMLRPRVRLVRLPAVSSIDVEVACILRIVYRLLACSGVGGSVVSQILDKVYACLNVFRKREAASASSTKPSKEANHDRNT